MTTDHTLTAHTTSPRRPTRRWVRSAAILLALATIASCGSRRSEGELLSAAGGSVGRTADAAGSGSDVSGATAAGPEGPGSSTGSGGDAAVAGTTVGGSSSATAANKSRVKIAALGVYSGILGASQGPYLDGLRVWIRWVNDHGGLNGHPVDPLIVADDGGDSARNRQLAQQLIQQDNVLALVFDAAFDGSGTVSYITQQGVPFVGGIGGGQYFYESPVYFPQMPQGFVLGQGTLGAVEDLARQGKKKLAVMACVEVASCKAASNVASRGASKYGAQVVYSTDASIAQPDFSAECLNAQSAGAQAFILAMDGASIKRVAQSCARQNFRPLYSSTSVVATPDMPQDENLQGMNFFTMTMPVVAAQPVLDEFKAAMARYAPGTQPVDGHVGAWATGKLLELGAKTLPAGDVATMRKALLSGLGGIPYGTDLGFTAPFQFHPGKPATPIACWFIERITDHKWASDGKRTCMPYDPALVL